MRRYAHHPRRPGHNQNASIRPGAPGSRNYPGLDRHSRRGRKHRKRQADAFHSFIAAFNGDMRVYAGIAAFIVFMFLIYLLGILAESVMPHLPLD
jgi:hypothetical protein